jgi:hypothetical protein
LGDIEATLVLEAGCNVHRHLAELVSSADADRRLPERETNQQEGEDDS